MRPLLAALAILHSACMLAPEQASESSGSGVRKRMVSTQVHLTVDEPQAQLRIASRAPHSTARVSFEMTPEDHNRLRQACANGLTNPTGMVDPGTPPLCQQLDPETGRQLGRDPDPDHLWQAATAAWVGAEYARDTGGSFRFERAAAWLFKDGQPERVVNTWWAPGVEQGGSFTFRILRAAELPAALFPELVLNVTVEITESDPTNLCFGEPDGRRVCCASEYEICECRGGQEIVNDTCPMAVLSGSALADEIASHGTRSAKEQVYCGMVYGQGITVPYPQCSFSLD